MPSTGHPGSVRNRSSSDSGPSTTMLSWPPQLGPVDWRRRMPPGRSSPQSGSQPCVLPACVPWPNSSSLDVVCGCRSVRSRPCPPGGCAPWWSGTKPPAEHCRRTAEALNDRCSRVLGDGLRLGPWTATLTAVIEFALLGPLEVRRDGQALRLGGFKQRLLLGVLLVEANRAVATLRLIELLWGTDPPETAANILQHYISQLRRILDVTSPRARCCSPRAAMSTARSSAPRWTAFSTW